MGKRIHKILSPAEMSAIEVVEKTRHQTRELLKEEIHREAALLRPDGEADVTNSDAQAGRRLSRSLIVSRLQKLNPAIRYAQSNRYPDHGGIYFMDPNYGFVATPNVPGRFICGIPHEYVNEFDVRITVPDVIPDPDVAMHWQKVEKLDAHEPGWLSILLRLAKERIIDLTRAEKVFRITEGRSSRNWQQAVN